MKMSNLLNDSLVSTSATLLGNEHKLQQFRFSGLDYSVFFIMLGISAAIGVYFGFFNKGEVTTEEYLMGGKRMKTLPIAISLVASQISGVTIMTVPAEMYAFGINWSLNVISMLIIVPILCWVVTPVFYNNNISNCYEYLQLRFNRKTREILTIAFLLTLFSMLPVYIFIPSLAFSQVTGINIHLINTIVCSICIFYTMFGGIKAVVWTDVVQGAIMALSVAFFCLMGVAKIGGFAEVFRIAHQGHRLDMNFSIDLRSRATFWNSFMASIIMWTSYVGLNQSCVQRIVSLPSLAHAKRSLFIFGAGFMLIMFFNCFTGLVVYARYADCDPLLTGHVSKPDKLLPYFVQDIVGNLNGMPGVFTSCIFSAALSTMSAGINCIAGVVYFDYIKPHIRHTEQRANFIMKAVILVCGVYCVLGGMLVEKFSSILQVVYLVSGLTFGTVFGVFLLGMLVPRVHGRAALWAVILSMSIMGAIVIISHGRVHYKILPGSIEGCASASITTTPASPFVFTYQESSVLDEPFNFFDISYNWYMPMGALLFFIIAMALSYLLPAEQNYKLNPKLLSPVIQPFVRYQLAHTHEMTEILSANPLQNID